MAFASVHRRMLLAASVEFWDDEDEASASIVSTSSSRGDRGAAIAEGCGQVLVGGLRRDVADGSGLALGAELVWSATSGEVSAANSLSSGLGLWRSMARVEGAVGGEGVVSAARAVDDEVEVVGGSEAVAAHDDGGGSDGGGGGKRLCREGRDCCLR